MIVYRVRRFAERWRETEGSIRLFLAWNAANTLIAFALLVGAFYLLVATSAPGFQRGLLLAYIAVAVAWLLSIFTIGPVYERVDPAGEREG